MSVHALFGHRKRTSGICRFRHAYPSKEAARTRRFRHTDTTTNTASRGNTRQPFLHIYPDAISAIHDRIEQKHSLPHMTITLSLVIVRVLTTNTLHAAHCPTNQTNRCIARHGPTLLTHQRFTIRHRKQVVKRQRQLGQPIDRRILQRHAAIELRDDLRMAIVRAPAGECVLQRILVGKVRKRWNTQHIEEPAIFCLLYTRRARARGGRRERCWKN